MTRNLIFHCYPRASGFWRRSVAHLKARWPIFTGRKIVSIALDGTTDDAEDVMQAFDDSASEFFCVQNNCLQEVASLPRLLKRIETQDPEAITLYAHSKGCTHADGSASHFWCDAMAAACLDYPALVECALSRAHVCGAFRSTMPIGWPSTTPWHFAGTWYWFRSAELFRREWEAIDQNFWGAESYPGQKFTRDESACLFGDAANTMHLYSREFWDGSILPAFWYWRRRLATCGLSPIASGLPFQLLPEPDDREKHYRCYEDRNNIHQTSNVVDHVSLP